ncbi:MAG: hypothetical protein EA358_11055 [Flavobacteriales bacterium]|nr:MAG: hypothetical protein EA358_11055 [Flavobacteriales bacterium]
MDSLGISGYLGRVFKTSNALMKFFNLDLHIHPLPYSSLSAAPAIAAESPQDKTPVDARRQERGRSSLATAADTAILAEDLQRKAR